MNYRKGRAVIINDPLTIMDKERGNVVEFDPKKQGYIVEVLYGVRRPYSVWRRLYKREQLTPAD